MRHLIIKREPALCAFALPYFCVVGREKEDFLEEVSQMGQVCSSLDKGRNADCAVRNGEVVGIEIGEEATTMFVAAFPQVGALTTEVVDIPAGSEDVRVLVQTRILQNKRASMTATLIEEN